VTRTAIKDPRQVRNKSQGIADNVSMKKILLTLSFCMILSGCAIANKTAGLSQAKELHKTGEPAQAKILEIADTGWTLNDDPVVSFLLEIYPDGQQPYQARTKIVISRVHIPQFTPGATVAVRIDPKDPTRVSLDIYEF
jgi:uncharacterized protein YceK